MFIESSKMLLFYLPHIDGCQGNFEGEIMIVDMVCMIIESLFKR